MPDNVTDDDDLMVVVDDIAVEPIAADERATPFGNDQPTIERELRQQFRLGQQRLLKGVGDVALTSE